jgi:hypothetical protein
MPTTVTGWRGPLRLALAAVAVLFAAPASLAAEVSPLKSFDPGHGAPAAEPAATRKVELSALPNAAEAQLLLRPRGVIGPLTGASAAEYARRKAIAASRGGAPLEAPRTPAPPARVGSGAPQPLTPSPKLSFAGNAQADCAGATPPKTPSDQALAIGDATSPVVQVNNDCLSVWSPTGVRLLGPKTLQSFAGLAANQAVFDPRVLYDWYNHRFILAFGDSDLVGSSNYDIAVSATDDPTGSWYVYRFATPARGSAYNDFIRLGQDRQGVYLASNLFNLSGGVIGAFLYEEWVFLPKSSLYAGTLGSNYWHQSGMQAFGLYTDSTQPANVWSPYDNPRAEFLVGSFNMNYGGGNCVNGCGNLMVWAVSNPFGWINGGPNPEVSMATTGTSMYSLPPNASQPGAPNSIETLDVRITGQVTYKSGVLHAALTTGDTTWSDVLVYRFLPYLSNEDTRCSGQYQFLCPQIVNAWTIEEVRANYGGNFAFFPTPQPDLEGNVLTVFNFSGPSCAICYPSVGFGMSRAASNGGWADYGLLIAPGRASYKGLYWGRYTAAAPFGVGYVSNGAVAVPGAGFAGSYVAANGNWATQIGDAAYTAQSQP